MKSFDLNHILSTHFNSLSLSALFLMQEWVSASKNLQLLQSALKQIRQDEIQELHDKGSLAVDNLCFYYHILVKTATTGKEKLLAHLSELKDAVWKMQSELRMQKIFSCHPLDHALHLCGFAEKKLLAFFQDLFPLFCMLRLDENILSYLVEHRLHLNSFLGAHYIEDLLIELFPEGISEMRKAIEEGYLRRGFQAVYQAIEPKIYAIEWEAPCPCAQK